MTVPRPAPPSATPPAKPPLLEAASLEHRFGAFRVLRGVSLTAGPGECHLVIGPNGAGKTTLLRLLAGLARPSAGSIRLDGVTLSRDGAARRDIGLLSHQSHLYDDLTATQNLSFAARLYGSPDPVRRARAALDALGLATRADEPVGRLSRGMVQRVAIARSLLHQPRLLLLDEPFTGLDPASAGQVAALFAAERNAGRTLVLVTHEVHEAWELATHAHVLVRGAWVVSGPREGTLEGFLRRSREGLHE
jgi:heme exporter protein A